MKIDENATRYEFGNGRFDLMTDEEVRTLDGSELDALVIRLAETMRQGETPIGQELYHHLYELWTRYPTSDFRLEIIPSQQSQSEPPTHTNT
jgi:hypothetical protein